jgi:hypothetical protein
MLANLHYPRTLAVLTLIILIAGAGATASQQAQSEMPKDKMSMNQNGMMDMSAMMQEPHHQLAMAYKANLVNFAKALQHEASQTKPIDAEFARTAVTEMKRNFAQMQQHHQGHMKAMDAKMMEQMAGMMKQMDQRDLAIQEDLAALDKEAQTSAPDAKTIPKYVDDILKNCDNMSTQGGIIRTRRQNLCAENE